LRFPRFQMRDVGHSASSQAQGVVMALKIRLARPTGRHPWASLALRAALVGCAAVALFVLVVGGYFYFKYQRIVDERLKQPMFATTAKIYAAPREVRPGQKLSVRLIANELRSAGYTADHRNCRNWAPTLRGRKPSRCGPGLSPFMRRTARWFISVREWWSRSPTTMDRHFRAMSWSLC